MPNVVQLRIEDLMDKKEFEAALVRRTRVLRERHGVDQKTMAEMLGIQGGTYRKYESRSPLPDHLKPKFCMIVQTNLDYLITGRHPGKARAPIDTRPRLTAVKA